ncbi:MAG: glycoside hydrolase family 31 protein [Saprospiraceae bacterium]
MEQEPKTNTDETAIPPTEERPKIISMADASVSERYEDVFEVIKPDAVVSVRWKDGSYEFVCMNGITLRVQFADSGIVRMRYAAEGHFSPDFSYALDPAYQTEKVTITLNENDNEYTLESEVLQVVISKLDLRTKIYDQSDRLICEDAGGFSARRTIMSGWSSLAIEKKSHKRELLLGLGDKTCGVNLSGKKYSNWCMDAYGFGLESDEMYRAIPFYYSLNHELAYGIFVDNSYKSHFDFNSGENGITRFSVDGGDMNYYFIYGPELLDVSRQYARLTGVCDLPPMWSLGFHQCRWSYYPESRVQEIAGEFRRREIPCDAIYLDIDYMDGYRCFTWDKKHFPDPKRLIESLSEQGFQTVCMIDPGVKEDPDYLVYSEGIEQGMFVKTMDGEVAKGPVWPGFCAFPDFTDPKVREWWGELYKELYAEMGVAGFWNDMNEPAVFHINHKTLPDTVMHHYDGHPCSHRKAHNIYGQQMCRSSWEGFKKLKTDKRPYLLTRAAFSGSQRFGAVWTGDNFSTWEHLQIANIQCQRLSISGFSFCGTDIGGFAGNADGELFVRWLQLGVFHPLMRVHSMGQHGSGDALPADEAELTDPKLHNSDQEPWSFGEKYTDLAKKAIELRYCILPCLYTAMWLHNLDGTPVLRHLLFADPADQKLWDQDRDFLFGEHILVSPIIQAKIQRQGVNLPKGNWYYFWTGQPGNGEQFVNVMPDQIPFFIREGAVLPVYPVRQHTKEVIEELTLYVYYKKGVETSHLYEDKGEGYAYQDGEFCLKIFETDGDDKSFTLRQRIEGSYTSGYNKVKIYFVGFPVFVKKCTVNEVEIPIKEIKLRDRSLYTLNIEPNFEKIEWQG